MPRILNFDDDGFYIQGADIYDVPEGTLINENQYLARDNEVTTFHKMKLVDEEIVEGLTSEEIAELEEQVEVPPTRLELLEAQTLENRFDIVMIQMGLF